jgi:hypothetical protein
MSVWRRIFQKKNQDFIFCVCSDILKSKPVANILGHPVFHLPDCIKATKLLLKDLFNIYTLSDTQLYLYFLLLYILDLRFKYENTKYFFVYLQYNLVHIIIGKCRRTLRSRILSCWYERYCVQHMSRRMLLSFFIWDHHTYKMSSRNISTLHWTIHKCELFVMHRWYSQSKYWIGELFKVRCWKL